MNVLRPLSSVRTPKYDSDKNHRAYYVFLRAVNFYYVPNFSGEQQQNKVHPDLHKDQKRPKTTKL